MSSRNRPRLLVGILALFLGAGCDDGPGPRVNPLRTRGGAVVETPAASNRPDEEPSTFLPRPAAPAPAPAPREAEPAVRRDELPEALQRAFGAPTACISAATREQLGATLRLHVSARVTGTGRVVSATVSGPALSPADLDCLRRHAEGLRLPGPIENAPRTVATTVEYQVASASARPAEPSPPPPRERQPGSVAPGSTLPAAGTVPGRPGGSVAPGSTLPASGTATERPPGFVPPSSTLPAVVD